MSNKTQKKRSWVEWAMRNYRITFLLIGLLIVLGIYGLQQMPKAEFPDFTVRQGVVVGVYPGASSQEVEERLARPLERYLFTFKEVKRSKTTSASQNGLCMLMVELQPWVKDKDEVWSKIKHGINAYKKELPQGVLDVVVNDEFGETSALLIAVESARRSYRELEKLSDHLGDELRRLPSVSNVRVQGTLKEQLSLYIDHTRLSAYGISAQQLLSTLQAQGATTMSGALQGWQQDTPIHVRPSGQTEEEIGNLIVMTDHQGRTVRVKDLVEIRREYDRSSGFVEFNGHRCAVISMEMVPGENIVQYGEDVDRILDDFRRQLPSDVQVHRISDQAQVVADSVRSFLRDLFVSMAVIIIVMMMLFPLRSAIVAAITIPMSTFISLGILWLVGIPLNIVTLAALIVVLGMIVDNSIVVIDGYLEHLNRGMSRWHAASLSARRYFTPLLLATVCISAIFFPLLITTSGQKNDFLGDFPWTIAINLLVSLVVAEVVIPLLGVWIIRRQKKVEGKKSITDYVQGFYDRLLSLMFRHGWATLGIGLLVMLSTAIFGSQVKTRMMPVSDRNQFAVEIYLPKGTGLAETQQVADSMTGIMTRDPRITAITKFVGCSSPRFQASYAPQPAGRNYAQFIVNTTSNEATVELLDELTPRYSDHFPNAFVKFKQLDSQMFNALEFRFYGEDLDSMRVAANQMLTYMRQRPELLRVRTDFDDPHLTVEVALDQVVAGQMGISSQLAAQQLMLQTQGVSVATMWEGDYGLPVIVKDEAWPATSPSAIGDMYVHTQLMRQAVPLRQLADVGPSWDETQIVHRNGVRCITVTADMQRDVTAADIQPELQHYLEQSVHIPQGVRVELGGEIEDDHESIPELGSGLAIAAVIIFFFLLFSFRKYGITVVSMLALLCFLPGAMFGLWATGSKIGITTVFGFITLMGMIMRNEILIFEHAEQRRAEGWSAHDAAYDAGRRRMVPIFLTTATTAIGVLPMVISGSSMWKPVGITIFFGGLGALVLVVTLLPVVYWKLYSKTK